MDMVGILDTGYAQCNSLSINAMSYTELSIITVKHKQEPKQGGEKKKDSASTGLLTGGMTDSGFRARS